MHSHDVDDLGLGPFFAVTPLPAGALTGTSPTRFGSTAGVPAWRNLADDVASATFVDGWVRRAALRRAETTGQDVREIDQRALRSVLHLGLCARILSPWIGRHLLGLSILGVDGTTAEDSVPTLSDLLWVDDGSTTAPLAVRHPTTADEKGPNTRPDQSFSFTDRLTRHLAAPLTDSPLVDSQAIAWGNVASAINGAVTAVSRHHPDRRADARSLAIDLLAALETARGVSRAASRPFEVSVDGAVVCSIDSAPVAERVHRRPSSAATACCGNERSPLGVEPTTLPTGTTRRRHDLLMRGTP